MSLPYPDILDIKTSDILDIKTSDIKTVFILSL